MSKRQSTIHFGRRCTAHQRSYLAALRTGATLAATLLLTSYLAGCATGGPSPSTTPSQGSQPRSSSPSSTPASTPPPANLVAVSTCCRATLPASWTAPKLIANGLYGASDPEGTLTATWQIVGSERNCPLEPASLTGSLLSPTDPSGDVISAVDSIQVDGKRVTVYVTSPSAATPRAYQYAHADAVLGANCVDLGAAEYGVASPSNLESLLEILATTRPMEYPLQP
jgi:hypothetical protein